MFGMPLILHPTKLMWVDDDELFLQVELSDLKIIMILKSMTLPKNV